MFLFSYLNICIFSIYFFYFRQKLWSSRRLDGCFGQRIITVAKYVGSSQFLGRRQCCFEIITRGYTSVTIRIVIKSINYSCNCPTPVYTYIHTYLYIYICTLIHIHKIYIYIKFLFHKQVYRTYRICICYRYIITITTNKIIIYSYTKKKLFQKTKT